MITGDSNFQYLIGNELIPTTCHLNFIIVLNFDLSSDSTVTRYASFVILLTAAKSFFYIDQRFLTFFSTSAPLLVTPKQSSIPYHWLKPGYYKDKEKTSAVHHVHLTFDRHIRDLPQHPLKLISAPQVKKP